MANLDENLNPDAPKAPDLSHIPPFLRQALGLPGSRENEIAVGPMTPDEVKAWNELQEALKTMKAATSRHENLKQVFWGKLKLDRNIVDFTSMRIDEKTGVIMMVPEKEDA